MVLSLNEEDPCEGWDKGWNEGWNESWLEGWYEGQREMLALVLHGRFGPLSSTAQERLNAWPKEQLLGFTGAICKANSLRDLGLED